jgi:hypothetical protein
VGASNQLKPDFLSHLREELLRQQDRRAEHVKAKFTFVVALYGLAGALQSIEPSDPLAVNLVIYSIPFVAVLFDFYVLGGEFAVKRIRSLLIAQDVENSAERRWATYLSLWPKDFMRRNRLLTTGFIDAACAGFAFLNLRTHKASTGQWAIWVIWLLVVIGLAFHLYGIEKMIRKSFADTLNSKSPEKAGKADRQAGGARPGADRAASRQASASSSGEA